MIAVMPGEAAIRNCVIEVECFYCEKVFREVYERTDVKENLQSSGFKYIGKEGWICEKCSMKRMKIKDRKREEEERAKEIEDASKERCKRIKKLRGKGILIERCKECLYCEVQGPEQPGCHITPLLFMCTKERKLLGPLNEYKYIEIPDWCPFLVKYAIIE